MGGACASCHAAKVRCDKKFPCSRCVSLSRVCVPHVSKQGQGKKKRKRKDNESSEGESKGDGAAVPSEAGVLSVEVSSSIKQRDHFGLHYMIRSWISFAVKRRSFSLLSRAAALGSSLGISMDEILCESKDRRGMDFLYPILLVPNRHQNVSGSALNWSEIPHALLVATGCAIDQQPVGEPASLRHRDNRWIWIREMKQGSSRFLASTAFGRDIASEKMMRDMWCANKQPVVDIFLRPPKERENHLRGFAHQISLHSRAGIPLQCSRLAKVPLTTVNGVVQVDQVTCLDIVNIDQAFYFTEYIIRRGVGDTTSVTESVDTTAPSPADPLGAPPMALPFDGLDEFVNDGELQTFLKLLE